MPPVLDISTFDPTRPLAMGRFNTVNGFALAIGESIRIVDDSKEPKERGEVTADVATRLWSGGTFVYADEARPTPVETPQQAAERLVEIDDLGGGWYLIRAPWLGEGEKVQGKEAADTRRAELVAAGQPTDTETDAATAAANAGGSGGSETGGAAGTDGGSGPTVEERVKSLVDGNTEKDLRDIIARLDEARAKADPPLPPLGAKSDNDKAELAGLIVGVDGDIATGGAGTTEA